MVMRIAVGVVMVVPAVAVALSAVSAVVMVLAMAVIERHRLKKCLGTVTKKKSRQCDSLYITATMISRATSDRIAYRRCEASGHRRAT